MACLMRKLLDYLIKKDDELSDILKELATMSSFDIENNTENFVALKKRMKNYDCGESLDKQKKDTVLYYFDKYLAKDVA